MSDVVDEVARSWRRVASTHDFRELLQQGPVPFSLADGATAQPTRRWFTRAQIYGVLLLLGCLTSCVVMGTSVVTKAMKPIDGHPWLRAVQDDWYYCMAVPGILPLTLVLIGFNWYFMKLFKHNG